MTTTVHDARTNQPTKALRHFNTITPDDDDTYSPPIVMVRIGGAGDMVATNLAGTDVTFSGLVAGEIIWGPFSKIKDTGTDATGIVGWSNEEANW